MTAQSIINAALRILNRMPAGYTPSATESSDMLSVLNDLLDNWNADRLLVHSNDYSQYSLVVGTQTYTIGPSGTTPTFTAVRPVKIISADVTVGTAGTYPVDVVTADRFASQNLNGATSDIVKILYCDYAQPKATLKVWPTPSYAGSLGLYTMHVFSAFPDLTTDVSLAYGYARALEYGLACTMAPRFGLALADVVLKDYDLSLQRVKDLNAQLVPAPPQAQG